jgi:hypothetical protein
LTIAMAAWLSTYRGVGLIKAEDLDILADDLRTTR